MAPKKAASAEDDSQVGLTPNENRFIKILFDNMTSKPDADWGNVARDLGLKDAKCARERFRQMSVRHNWGTGTSPRKPKADALEASGDTKVQKKPRARKPKKESSPDADVKSEVKDEDEEEEEVEV